MENLFAIHLLPNDDDKLSESLDFFKSAVTNINYRLRIVKSLNELLELIVIFESGLDDRCIQVIKSTEVIKEGQDEGNIFFMGLL